MLKVSISFNYVVDNIIAWSVESYEAILNLQYPVEHKLSYTQVRLELDFLILGYGYRCMTYYSRLLVKDHISYNILFKQIYYFVL